MNKPLKTLIIGALALAGAWCASAVEPQAWFDTQIASYTEWPTNNAALYGGLWSNDEGAVLEAGALAVDADDETPLTFEATDAKTLVGGAENAVVFTAQAKFFPVASAGQLPTAGGAKAALAVVAEGGDVLRYYGLAKDGTTNAWVRLSDTVDAVTNALVDVTVSVKGASVCYQAGALNVTNEVVLGSSAISKVELSGSGTLAALSATSKLLTSVVTPQSVANASYKVYTNEVEVASPYIVTAGDAVTVVYTAYPGYVFAGGATTATAVFTADAAEVSVPQDQLPKAPYVPTGVTVNGMDVGAEAGDGWIFAGGILSLANEKSYVLAGTNTAGAVRVEVTAAKASVTLDNLKLTGLETTNMLTFASAATLTLVGDNTVYATNDFAGVCILEGASVTLSGNGALVGGKAKSWCSRGVNVYGTLTMDGGTIRDYLGLDYAGGLYVGETGVMTMNGGSIANNEVHGYGGGINVRGMFTMNGGAISGNLASNNDGGGIWNGGTTVINGGVIANNTANIFGGAVLSDSNGTVTMNGGEVTGNKIAAPDKHFGGSAFGVYGTLIVNGGRIHDNDSTKVYTDCVVARGGGTASIYGGVFKETRYFRVGEQVYGPHSDPLGVINLYGCVSYAELKDYIASGYECECLSPEEGDNLYIVGKDVVCSHDDTPQLTGGTYTFCPTNAEYVAAYAGSGELLVKPGVPVTKVAGTPVTWVLGEVMTYPDYLAGQSYAVTNTFNNWAKTYGSRDPDGVYTNAFLLNVATNREAAAVAAFKIESLVVTNDVVDITVAKPIDGMTMYNGKAWLQCVTNDLSKADWLDIEDGRYTEGDKSFFTLRIDFEHKVTPEAFPKEATGSKTMRVYQH